MEVAVYAISMQFMMMYMNFSTAVSSVMLPKVTMMVARHAPVSELTELMIRIGRLQYLLVGYIFVMFALVGRDFIRLWAGEGYAEAYPIVLLLMAALLIPLVQNVGISILMAMNLNRYRMTAYTICAVLALVASFPMAHRWGGWGCAVATAAQYGLDYESLLCTCHPFGHTEILATNVFADERNHASLCRGLGTW